MARVRRRGHAALLRAAAARSGLCQIEPAEDHRRWHRLALPRRAETRAEGVTARATIGRAFASKFVSVTRRKDSITREGMAAFHPIRRFAQPLDKVRKAASAAAAITGTKGPAGRPYPTIRSPRRRG